MQPPFPALFDAAREVHADRAQRRAPAHPEAGAAADFIVIEIVEGVAGVGEHRQAPLFADRVVVLQAADQQVAAADHFAVVVHRAQGFVGEAAHAGVTAGEKADRGGQLGDVGDLGVAHFAAGDDAAVEQREDQFAPAVELGERRRRRQCFVSAAYLAAEPPAEARVDRVVVFHPAELEAGDHQLHLVELVGHGVGLAQVFQRGGGHPVGVELNDVVGAGTENLAFAGVGFFVHIAGAQFDFFVDRVTQGNRVAGADTLTHAGEFGFHPGGVAGGVDAAVFHPQPQARAGVGADADAG